MPYRFLCCLCACLFLPLSVPSALATSPSPTPAIPANAYEAFDARFRTLLSDAGIPGGAYAIVEDGRLAHASGYGVRSLLDQTQVGPDTVFRTASVSKTFAAQLAAILVDDGKLDWDDEVSRYVPGFRLKAAPGAAPLRVRHLVGQSTGIVPNAYDNLLEADEPLSRIIPQFRTLAPMCAPGACYSYQNILFALIEPALDQASGQDYGELLHERLLRPLDMRDSSVGLDAFLATDNRAMPHVRRRGVWLPTTVKPGYYRVAPAAGVNASVRDLGQWLVAQMGGHADVVRPELVDTLTGKRIRTPRELRRRGWRDLLTDAHYGLGWRIYTIGDEDLVMHSGWVEGFVADIGYSPSRRAGLAVVLNAESSVINEITTGFWVQTLGIERAAPD